MRAWIAPTADRGERSRRAFSLVELLALLAVIVILIGLLLPGLGGVRHSARQSQCAAMQRQLALGLLRYASEHNEWIPGFNTSGRSLWPPAALPPQRAIAALSKFPHAPVQVNDWISPSLSDSALPVCREERFYTILERVACPEMEWRVPVWIGGDAGSLRMAQWIENRARQPARGISYLMPTNFQLFGGPRVRRPGQGDVLVTQESSLKLLLLARICRLRADYAPRVDSLGRPARKVALADAFRFLGPNMTDFDASYSHANWGSFTERSPCDVDSRSWGRRGGGGTGWNIPVVYRHRKSLNAAFWDGHVEPLSIRESRNPALWAPTRSVLQPAAGMEPDVASFGYDPADPTRAIVE